MKLSKLFLFISSWCFVQSAVMKRSKIHEQFPDYSLKYKYPTLCDTTSKQVSGYFELPDGKNFFFWFIESLSNPSKDPLLLWLNGGPGCSSLLGSFMGVGPCSIQNDQLIRNPSSWTSNASVIFLDQPIKSGYSFHRNKSYTVTDSNTASEDVYIFLRLFLQEFSEFAMTDLHMAGESYAGHFLPAFANTILERNSRNDTKIHLKSIMMGNGLTDPLTQYQYYQSMACDVSPYGVLIKAPDTCNQLKVDQRQCKTFIQKCYQHTNSSQIADPNSKEDCIMAASVCNSLVVKPILDTLQVNMYDIRRPCEDGPLCYDYFGSIKNYLDRSAVKSALGVDPSLSFELCNSHVNADFQGSGDWMRPYVKDVTTLLNHNISVLAYAGDADFLCHWKGIRAWTLNVPWYDKEQYNVANDTIWFIDSRAVGEVRAHGPLSFVKLYQAGHMATYDQPSVALNMMNNWIHK